MHVPDSANLSMSQNPSLWMALPSAPCTDAVVPVRPSSDAVVPMRPSNEAVVPIEPSPISVARESVTALFIVYDADGTPAGELIYMTKKMLGLGHCAACDITHGPRKEKPEFTKLKNAGWGVPVFNIHRDEMDPALAATVGSRLPCVAARTSSRDVVLLGQKALATCEGDVGGFRNLVDFALHLHGLYAPPACARSFTASTNAAPVPVFEGVERPDFQNRAAQ